MIETIQPHQSTRRVHALQDAIRQTLAYGDVFDYPLTAAELHRYLHGIRASPAELRAILQLGVPGVQHRHGLFVLDGRLCTLAERRRRQAYSVPLVKRTRRYARVISCLPFVRMVGLTGSLAMRNVLGRGDIDLMIVTAPGRVWLGRAAVIALVHLARLRGDTLCPNYVVGENALVLGECSIYDAHELVQMIPLYGGDVYRRLWESNPHITGRLPNAQPWQVRGVRGLPIVQVVKRGVERLLGGAVGDVLECWERRRKTDRLAKQRSACSPEIVLSPEQCKGHFDGHRTRVLKAFQERLTQEEGGAFLSTQPDSPARREATGSYGS